MTPTVEVWGLNHWTARRDPQLFLCWHSTTPGASEPTLHSPNSTCQISLPFLRNASIRSHLCVQPPHPPFPFTPQLSATCVHQSMNLPAKECPFRVVGGGGASGGWRVLNLLFYIKCCARQWKMTVTKPVLNSWYLSQ